MKTILHSIILSTLFITFSIANIINVPADQPTIQAGIDAAANGDTVLVADSTYYENINFIGKAIIVASHFLIDGDTTHIDSTIIDGSQPSNPDSGTVVFFGSGEDTTSVLYGFTITNGSGTQVFVPNLFDFRGGGGIAFNSSGGRIISNKIISNILSDDNGAIGGGILAGPPGSDFWIILENNQIVNNSIDGINDAMGGGIYLGGNGRIVNNNISYNSCTATQSWAGGGGVHTYASASLSCTVSIKDNQITNNFVQGKSSTTDPWAAFGGGIKVYRSKVSILNNEISHNQLEDIGSGDGSGGGIYMYLAANGSVIRGNKISYNKSECIGTNYGGGVGLGTCYGVAITNNIIFLNSSSQGGGIRVIDFYSEIINNTIVNNIASSQGGGLFSHNSNPKVINTILWDNQAGNGLQISGSATVRYSDVQGGYSGTGNINADPMFADTILYELSDSSKCVGWGADSVEISGSWYYAPCIDYGDGPRPHPIDEYVDIGAQESPYPKIIDIINEDLDNLPKTFSLSQNYPNPFNPSTTIEFNLPKSEFVELKVYNILGKEVSTLVSNKLNQGNHTYQFDGNNLASGIYYYHLTAGDYREVKKMILLR